MLLPELSMTTVKKVFMIKKVQKMMEKVKKMMEKVKKMIVGKMMYDLKMIDIF